MTDDELHVLVSLPHRALPLADSSSHLAGCYSNLFSNPDESLTGYLLRLADSNGYSGIRKLLAAANISPLRDFAQTILEIRANLPSLQRLASMAVGHAEHLDGYSLQRLGPDAVLIDSCRVEIDGLILGRMAYCPVCLAQDGFSRAEWEVGAVTACAIHSLQLHDECPHCRAPASWNRASFLNCKECGTDYRTAPQRPATHGECMVAMDFAALAPFRVLDAQGDTYTIRWDQMFNIYKAVLLPDECWVTDNWKTPYIANLGCTARHVAIAKLTECHENASYDLRMLAPKLYHALGALSVIPRDNIVERTGIRFLEAQGGLSQRSALAMCRAAPPPEVATAADIFDGRPPHIKSDQELVSFLGVDMETIAALVAWSVLTPPRAAHLGYDADELVNLKRFLQEDLITIDELETIVGTPIDPQDLRDTTLLPRWNPRNKGDARVSIQRVLSAHLALLATWHRSPRHNTGVSIGEWVQGHENAFEAVVESASLVISRDITIVGWRPPFNWTSILLDPASLERITRWK